MLVELIYIEVPDKTTRRMTVPEYDIPIIRTLWRKLPPGTNLKVVPSGLVVPRNFQEELRRMRNEYGAVPDGAKESAYRVVYGTDDQLLNAYKDACAKGAALHERAQEALAEAEARRAQVEDQEQARRQAELRETIRAEVERGIAEATDPAFEQEMRARIEAEVREKVEAETRARIEAEVRAELAVAAGKNKKG